ncbi:MAG: prolyl hydroxylase family protein, partial [Gammaproteobacteria bacterium]
LNTVESGGETFFPRLDLAVPAVRGNLLCFSNCIEGSAEVHPLSLHESKTVTAGEKWVAALWFRE